MVFVRGILLLAVFVKSVLSQGCTSTSKITGQCYCHFIGACDWTVSPPKVNANPKLALPESIEDSFAKDPIAPNTADICEGTQDSLAILYDCDLRIPLYAARVLTDADIQAPYNAKTQRTNFRETKAISKTYVQKAGDYGPRPKDQIGCYESQNTGGAAATTSYFENNWYPKAKLKGKPPQPCIKAIAPYAGVDKGHLIASNYGKSATNSRATIRDTFYLSNVVPQFADMNRIAWLQHEQRLLKWAIGSCSSATTGQRNAHLFIIVGVIPSTFANFDERWFGFPGFSDYEGKTGKTPLAGGRTAYKSEYRINLPAVMWTAACCEYEKLNPTTNKWDQKYITAAFWGENKPDKPPVKAAPNVALLFPDICAATNKCPLAWTWPELFPQKTACI